MPSGASAIFLNAIFGGVTLGALYFLVASGFTLIFGLMRNVNLAHGSLYLLGGYLGFEVSEATGSWLLAFPVVFILVGLLGMLLQHQVFRRMEGEELRQTMVTIGLSVRDRRYPAVDLGRAVLHDPGARHAERAC
jgi:branched-chain amino acid transport system permease protein